MREDCHSFSDNLLKSCHLHGQGCLLGPSVLYFVEPEVVETGDCCLQSAEGC